MPRLAGTRRLGEIDERRLIFVCHSPRLNNDTLVTGTRVSHGLPTHPCERSPVVRELAPDHDFRTAHPSPLFDRGPNMPRCDSQQHSLRADFLVERAKGMRRAALLAPSIEGSVPASFLGGHRD